MSTQTQDENKRRKDKEELLENIKAIFKKVAQIMLVPSCIGFVVFYYLPFPKTLILGFAGLLNNIPLIGPMLSGLLTHMTEPSNPLSIFKLFEMVPQMLEMFPGLLLMVGGVMLFDKFFIEALAEKNEDQSHLSKWDAFLKQAKKWGLGLLAPLGLIGFAMYSTIQNGLLGTMGNSMGPLSAMMGPFFPFLLAGYLAYEYGEIFGKTPKNHPEDPLADEQGFSRFFSTKYMLGRLIPVALLIAGIASMFTPAAPIILAITLGGCAFGYMYSKFQTQNKINEIAFQKAYGAAPGHPPGINPGHGPNPGPNLGLGAAPAPASPAQAYTVEEPPSPSPPHSPRSAPADQHPRRPLPTNLGEGPRLDLDEPD